MAKQLTVRGVPDEVADRLDKISKARGQSMNATINALLAQAAGEDARRRWLERFVTWTADDLAEFEEALAAQRTIDDALWRG
jgi:predicted transcriptional regulator